MAYLTVDQIAPDTDHEVICPGCNRLTITVLNQPIYLTFGIGRGMPLYDQAEVYVPVTGQIGRQFDAVKFRAYTPAANLPAGALQARVQLVPVPAGA